MLSISDIFTKDIKSFYHIKNSMEDEYKGKHIPKIETKKEYRDELESKRKTITATVKNKLAKVELYFVGVSFVILTGLVTNQLYTSSIITMKSDMLSWGSFFVGHIFVIASFVLLMLFAKELTKLFTNDSEINNSFIILPTILIPIFSQINSGMINLTQGDYTQIGFSSIVVGVLLVKYVVLDMLNIQKEIEPILTYIPQEVVYRDSVGLGEL